MDNNITKELLKEKALKIGSYCIDKEPPKEYQKEIDNDFKVKAANSKENEQNEQNEQDKQDKQEYSTNNEVFTEKIKSPEIKIKIIEVIGKIGTKGLDEDKKAEFKKEFEEWDEILFDVLDIGEQISKATGGKKIEMSPPQAIITFLVLSISLIILLRPDLQKKIFSSKNSRQKKHFNN